MSNAMESGDVTFIRSVATKPSPPSLDYHCAKCRKPITDWTESYIHPVTTKLHLVGKCHGDRIIITVYLNCGGVAFNGK